MDLIKTFIESIYKYGNIKVSFLSSEKQTEYTIFLGTDNKLKIQMKKRCIDTKKECIDTEEEDILNEEMLINLLAILTTFELDNLSMMKKKVQFDADKKEILPDSIIETVNFIYQKTLPLIDTNYDYMKELIGSSNLYITIINSYDKNKTCIETPENFLSYDRILQSLLRKVKMFKQTFQRVDLHTNYSLSKQEEVLAQLYSNQHIKQKSSNSIIELESIDISYEFLTDKFYSTDPSVGREKEIIGLENTLLTPNKSAILVGPPGTGKTAIVEGLAHRIRTNQVPTLLKHKRILKISTTSIVRGCIYVGQFEEKVEQIMSYLMENPDIILFIDEIHTSIGAGTGNKSNIDLANIMKPYIDRGEIKLIGATTDEEYNQYISSDAAFKRRFIKTVVSEPTDASLYSIISENILKYEKQTEVNWEFDFADSDYIINHLITCTAEKNRLYDDKRYNPDLVLSILELTFAIASRNDSKKIMIDHILEAIQNCSVIYPSIKERAQQELKNAFNSTQNQPLVKSRKIIPFQPRKI